MTLAISDRNQPAIEAEGLLRRLYRDGYSIERSTHLLLVRPMPSPAMQRELLACRPAVRKRYFQGMRTAALLVEALASEEPVSFQDGAIHVAWPRTGMPKARREAIEKLLSSEEAFVGWYLRSGPGGSESERAR